MMVIPWSYIREALSIANSFESISFIHVFREANEAAHIVAHLHPLDYSTRIWVGGWLSESYGGCNCY